MNNWIWIFITAVLILLMLACIGYDRWQTVEQRGFSLASFESRAQVPPLCVADEATREQLRGIMIDALDNALKEQIQHLFLTWLKDERSQPERARVGVEQAIRAHQRARKGALEWMPPICAG